MFLARRRLFADRRKLLNEYLAASSVAALDTDSNSLLSRSSGVHSAQRHLPRSADHGDVLALKPISLACPIKTPHLTIRLQPHR
jgi:hypothetical protein